MRQILWFPAVLLLLGACSSTPPRKSDPDPVPRDRTSVTVLSAELGMRPSYESSRNRLVLKGRGGSIALYPGTSVALVNGKKVRGMQRIENRGGVVSVSRTDASRLRTALSTAPRAVSTPRAVPPRSALRQVPASATLRAPAPDPAWNVKLRRKWAWIVIHHSATASGSAASFHIHHKEKNGWDGLGYHFVIGNGHGTKDGKVETGYRWTRQITGAHAGRAHDDSNLMNELGIGICLVGDFEKSRPTRKQLESLHRLVDWLEMACGISPDRVLVHRDVRDTKCPGRLFPAREFLENRRTVPQVFRETARGR
jgi:hypothetical protein